MGSTCSHEDRERRKTSVPLTGMHTSQRMNASRVYSVSASSQFAEVFSRQAKEHRLPVCVGYNAASPPDVAVNRCRKYHRRPVCVSVWGPKLDLSDPKHEFIKFQKNFGGKILQINAEGHKNECYPMTVY
jgi:hypothetical protein